MNGQENGLQIPAQTASAYARLPILIAFDHILLEDVVVDAGADIARPCSRRLVQPGRIEMLGRMGTCYFGDAIMDKSLEAEVRMEAQKRVRTPYFDNPRPAGNVLLLVGFSSLIVDSLIAILTQCWENIHAVIRVRMT